jgi:hypothetical protein
MSEQALQTTPMLLDEAAGRRHLRMADLLPAMERALIDLSAGEGVQPARSGSGVRACARGWLIRTAAERIFNDSIVNDGRHRITLNESGRSRQTGLGHLQPFDRTPWRAFGCRL